MTTRKIPTKAIAQSVSTYVGRIGEIFYDTSSATLKLSDGATAGGVVFAGGSASWPVTNTAGASGPTLIAIGQNAGLTSQGVSAVAIGKQAGETTQGNYSVAVGYLAGTTSQGVNAVAVGIGAGQTNQGASAVAIGDVSGYTNQGVNAVSIGKAAGATNQANNSIIINATGAALNQTTASTFTVKPVRDAGAASGMTAAGFRPCYYNPTTGEVVYTSS